MNAFPGAPGPGSPRLVGEQVVWTATPSNCAKDLVYQFSLRPRGDAFRVVRDFSPHNTFSWSPMQEGSYDIRVIAKEGYRNHWRRGHLRPRLPTGLNSSPLVAADFDSEGRPDLAVANQDANTTTVLLNAADDAAFFYLDAPAQVPASQPFDLTVNALSGDGQRLAHGYRGTVAFGSSDPQATLPEPYTFRPEDWGIASFPGGVTLRTPGTQYLVAFDLETFTVIGYAVVDVFGAAPGGGGGGAPFGAADCALAQMGLDLLTWTRPRPGTPIAAGTASPCGTEKLSTPVGQR
jgi:hypothetical protein